MGESRFGRDAGHRQAVVPREVASRTPCIGATGRNSAATGRLRDVLDRFFYLGMALLVAAVVIFGFSQTIDGNLLHPDEPRPWLLFVHAIVFASWIVLFTTQSALVRVAKVGWHRRLGLCGAVLGGILPVVGVTTALVMLHWHVQREGGNGAGLSLPFNDMMTFAITFWLAMYWRRRPEFHRRLMLIATCCLTGAAFARFPEGTVPANGFYACVDLLILLGVLRDLIVTRRVHVVYRYALPCMMASQALAQYLLLAKPTLWLSMTQRIVQWMA